MEERVVIDRIDYGKQRAIYPDVRVYEDRGIATPTKGGTSAAVAEPIILEFEAEEHTETYVTILTADGDQLVTVIEFLSPTNKLPGPGRHEYRRKREELIGSRINFVEVDLVRQGSWRELLRPVLAPVRIETAYRVITRRFHSIRRVELFPMSLRQPLSRIPIPLRDQDTEVALDLQDLVSQAYRNGRYDHTDYTKPCDLPLDPDDAQWADELLRGAGLRRAS
jgi:hypothetical protein